VSVIVRAARPEEAGAISALALRSKGHWGFAADLGMHTLEIDSDPYAEPFYRHAGAVRTGEAVSTVDPDRRLPHLTLPVG
jgi:hypothetical protein